MNRHKNPKWWKPENDSAWNRVKKAMKRDWEQIKHALGIYKSFEELESACRFGYVARLKFGKEYSDWDANFEMHLAEAWRAMDRTRRQKWEHDRQAIRYGWNFDAEISEARPEVKN
jgi:hypothetical protein